MSTLVQDDKPGPELRNLAAGDVISVIGRSGSVVRVLQGRVWVTQEGDARDYVVPAGTRFCAAGDGRIVVSAVAGNTHIAVYRVHPTPHADWSHNRIHLDPDFVSKVRREAHQMQALYFGDLLARLWRRIRQALLGRHGKTTTPTVIADAGRTHCVTKEST